MPHPINNYVKVSCLLACLSLPASAKAQTAKRGYLEPGACNGCHREIAESYALTGMARTFGLVKTENDFPELKMKASVSHPASEQSFTIYSQEGKTYVRRQQVGFDGSVTNSLTARIDYWFGSGNHARSFISRTRSGKLIELPVTWYRENGGYWAMSPGYDRSDHAGFSRAITYRCMFCHNAYPAIEDTLETSTRFPEDLPEGIDCQRCHGPGQNHIDAIRQNRSSEIVRSSIVNPARLTPERSMEVCMQCHLETTSLRLPANLLRYGRTVFSYRSGEPLEDYILHFDRPSINRLPDRFEFDSSAYRLRMSPCFSESRGNLVCTTCHNPHEPRKSTI